MSLSVKSFRTLRYPQPGDVPWLIASQMRSKHNRRIMTALILRVSSHGTEARSRSN